MKLKTTRRQLLAGIVPSYLAYSAAPPAPKKAQPLPKAGPFLRFADPTTETPVVGLTDPATASFLPAATNRYVSLRGRFLVFSSQQEGQPSAIQLDLRNGSSKTIVAAAGLAPRSLFLGHQEKSLYFLDGATLKQVGLSGKGMRTVAEDVSSYSLSATGVAVVIRRGRLEQLGSALGSTGGLVAEGATSFCLLRPGGKGCAFGRAGSDGQQEFWYAPLPSLLGGKEVLLAKGRVSNPMWSPDGRGLFFLRDTEANGAVISDIRLSVPETGVEQQVAKTSQFAAFAVNGNGTVFVGASRSHAQPTIVLLLGTTQRELTLCEHRAKEAASVSPVFSPDSRRIYFQSDHQGRSALFSVNVENWVEPTTPTDS